MRKIVMGAFLMVMMVASIGADNFRDIEWGIPPVEVEAMYSGVIPERFENEDGFGLGYDDEVIGRKAIITYGFVDEKLYVILIHITYSGMDVVMAYDTVMGAIASKYLIIKGESDYVNRTYVDRSGKTGVWLQYRMDDAMSGKGPIYIGYLDMLTAGSKSKNEF